MDHESSQVPHSAPHDRRRFFIDGVPPRTAFSLGIAIGVGVVGVIGFLVLLPGALSGTSGNTATAAPSSGTPVAAAPSPAPTFAPPPPAPPPDLGDRVGTFRPIDPKVDHIRGDIAAPVKIIEYSDTECPFCKRFHPTMQQVVKEYPGKVAWVYRHLPLRSLHAKAAKEAEATECANELGGNEKFWAYLDRMFDVTPSNDGLDLAQLPRIAVDVGLDRAKFETCLNSGKYAQHVSDDENDATSAGARGTPFSIVLGTKGEKIPIGGALPFGSVKQVIDSVLQ